MWTRLRKILVILTRPLAFAVAGYMLWWVFADVPGLALEYYHYRQPSGAYAVSPYVAYSHFLVAPLRMAVYVTIGWRILYILQDNLRNLTGRIVPPYHPREPSQPELPMLDTMPYLAFRHKMKRGGQAFAVAIAVFFLNMVFYVESFTWRRTLVERMFENLPTDLLLAAGTFLLSMPLGRVSQYFYGDMNQATLFATIIFVWIPLPLLVVAYLNWISALYGILRVGGYFVAQEITEAIRKEIESVLDE